MCIYYCRVTTFGFDYLSDPMSKQAAAVINGDYGGPA
jgi:hypothetical protein